MCDRCKQGDHSWCDRVMKTRGSCTCLNHACSNMNAERYGTREG